MTDDGRRRTEDGGWKTDDGRRKTEIIEFGIRNGEGGKDSRGQSA